MVAVDFDVHHMHFQFRRLFVFLVHRGGMFLLQLTEMYILTPTMGRPQPGQMRIA